MDNRENLSSYDRVEELQLNMTNEELAEYLESKLASAKYDVEFISRRILFGNRISTAVEIGGGNGKLLFELIRRGIIEKGINFEVSTSRCRLCRRFAELLGDRSIEVRNENFLDSEYINPEVDLIIGVDVVIQIISPLYDSAEEDAITWAYNSLKRGGVLYLEMNDYTEMIKHISQNGGVIREWAEFEESDPFRYSLNKYEIDNDGFIIMNKVFLGRDGLIKDHMRNVVKSYTPTHIRTILEEKGFKVEVYDVPKSEYNLDYVDVNPAYRVVAIKE